MAVRVLVATWAWPTHFFPLVPLARALRAAGNEVLVASQPALLPVIREAGLPAVGAGTDEELSTPLTKLFGQDPNDRSRREESRTVRCFADIAETMTAPLSDLVRRWRPSLVLYEETTYAAPLVAAAAGVPAVRHLWGIDVMSFVRWSEPISLAGLTERLGAGTSAGSLVTTVDPCPASLQVAGDFTRTPIRYIPYNGTAPVPSLLHRPAGRPRVCVTYGRTLSRVERASSVIEMLVTALGGLAVDVVAAVSPADRARLGTPPANVTVVENQPLADFLPQCSLVVSHGGPGTVLTAAAYGLPQLIIPQVADQRLLAGATSALGAAERLAPEEVTVDVVRAAVTRLLASEQAREACRLLREEIHERPAPAAVARELTALATA
ncbi:MAG TPA: nucleotide disphospho-sugar-binding domain-containing protein [Streptosporangiaceae bacterium]|nr:nucleotide disphospho-sugar-binding domain-containing protein [Streptosporangiaceae bacterium]